MNYGTDMFALWTVIGALSYIDPRLSQSRIMCEGDMEGDKTCLSDDCADLPAKKQRVNAASSHDRPGLERLFAPYRIQSGVIENQGC